MQKYYSQWQKLEKHSVPDGMGGTHTEWIPGRMMLGAVTDIRQRWEKCGGRTVIHETGMLAHEGKIQLQPGDRVKRVKDSAIFEVCGTEQRPPACSWNKMAQCPVERTVEEQKA